MSVGHTNCGKAAGERRFQPSPPLTAFGIRNVPTTLENLRNQPYSVANLGLTKNFKMGETRRIQIRAEALNAFNHPYFGSGMGLNPGTAAAQMRRLVW